MKTKNKEIYNKLRLAAKRVSDKAAQQVKDEFYEILNENGHLELDPDSQFKTILEGNQTMDSIIKLFAIEYLQQSYWRENRPSVGFSDEEEYDVI